MIVEALECKLELGMLGLYFSDENADKSEISDWIRSHERTPGLRHLTVKAEHAHVV